MGELDGIERSTERYRNEAVLLGLILAELRELKELIGQSKKPKKAKKK